MSRCALLAVLCTVVSAAGCYKSQSGPQVVSPVRTAHTVFTDSVLHLQLCQPGQPGDSWRVVCVPRDQGVNDGAVRRKP
jgi:hypothetical protein